MTGTAPPPLAVGDELVLSHPTSVPDRIVRIEYVGKRWAAFADNGFTYRVDRVTLQPHRGKWSVSRVPA